MSEEIEEINILLVDDLPENLLALETAVEGSGYNIFKANSGEDALRLVLKHESVFFQSSCVLCTIRGQSHRCKKRVTDSNSFHLTGPYY